MSSQLGSDFASLHKMHLFPFDKMLSKSTIYRISYVYIHVYVYYMYTVCICIVRFIEFSQKQLSITDKV